MTSSRFSIRRKTGTFLSLLRLTGPNDLFLHYVKLIVLIGLSIMPPTSQEIDIRILFVVAFVTAAEIFTFVVNDLFDMELDALDLKTRNPLARGEISKRVTTIIALIFLSFSFFLLFFLPLTSIILGVAGLILGFAYSWGVRAKLKPVLDLLYHGVLNTFPFIIGYTLYKAFDETSLLLSFAIIMGGAVSKFVEEIRDYDFDRFFGKTTVVVLGKRKSLIISLGFVLIWFLVFATLLDRLLSIPITLWGFRLPFQFLVLPPLTLFISTPLVQGIISETDQKDVYKRLRKRGMVVLLILVASSATLVTYSSTAYFYGDLDYENHVVRLNVRTVIAGSESWNVAFITFSYLDEANHYYLLLDKNGVLELTKVVASEKTFLVLVKTELSPFDWHSFEILLDGSSIKVSIDEILYLDIIDDSLSNGIVCLRAFKCAILAFFNDIEVYSI